MKKEQRKISIKNPQHIYTKRLIAAIPETDPRLKEQLIANRIKVEKEYKELEKEYYNEKGRVYDLVKLTDTHYVAKKEVKIICGKPYLRRFLLMIPQLIILSILVFILAKLMPGDPFTGQNQS